MFLRRKRAERNALIVEKLRGLGLAISMDDVREAARGESVGRPHIADVLLRKGYAKDSRQAFQEYLGSRGKAFVPKEVLGARSRRAFAGRLGATVCLAHPMLQKYPGGWLEGFTGRLAGYGLTTIEAWHSEHSEADVRACLALARRFGLGVSGGSDYHGGNKPGIRLGVGRGGLRVGLDVLENLEAARRAQGLPC